MVEATLLLAYLDPGSEGHPWRGTLVAVVVIVLFLVVLYGLTRFVMWAARR